MNQTTESTTAPEATLSPVPCPLPPDMPAIEAKAHAFAKTHADLTEVVQEIEALMEAIRRDYRTKLKNLVSKAKGAKLDLQNAVELAPHLFVKPKSVILHGIKVGFRSGAAKLEVADEETTLNVIPLEAPELQATLVRTVQSLNRKALVNLEADLLTRLGCQMVPGETVTLAEPVDSNVDKLVEALLKDEAEA